MDLHFTHPIHLPGLAALQRAASGAAPQAEPKKQGKEKKPDANLVSAAFPA